MRPGIFRETLPPISSLDWQERPAERRRRFLESILAVALTRESPVVFSHRSALAILGLPLLDPWPDRIDILEPPDSARRSGAGVRVHRLRFDPGDVISWGEFFATGPARTLAGSAGESGGRVIMAMLGAPKPELSELQVRHPSPVPGRSFFVTGFEWPGLRKIGEFDGREKHLKEELLAGRSAGQVLYEEKLREDALRAEGNEARRWGMSAVRRPPLLREELGRLGVPMLRANRHLKPPW